jgi:hypothetical protein
MVEDENVCDVCILSDIYVCMGVSGISAHLTLESRVSFLSGPGANTVE